jgi:hypothetical protein
MRHWDRREFLALLASLPGAVLIGCNSGGRDNEKLSPRDAMKKLIIALGPWTVEEKTEAEDFAERFLNAQHAVGPYLPASSSLVQSLAARFPDGTMAIREINLADLPAEERKLLGDLTGQLYGYNEMRFLVCGEPQAGECQGDNTWHTHAPGTR